jgi:hypothetical protein
LEQLPITTGLSTLAGGSIASGGMGMLGGIAITSAITTVTASIGGLIGKLIGDELYDSNNYKNVIENFNAFIFTSKSDSIDGLNVEDILKNYYARKKISLSNLLALITYDNHMLFNDHERQDTEYVVWIYVVGGNPLKDNTMIITNKRYLYVREGQCKRICNIINITDINCRLSDKHLIVNIATNNNTCFPIKFTNTNVGIIFHELLQILKIKIVSIV